MKWQETDFASAPFVIIDGDRGKQYPKQHDFFEFGHCLFLNAKNVTAEGFDFSSCQFITEQKDSQLRKGRLLQDDVVLTTRGTIGNVAHFGERVPFDNLRINSGMVILRCFEGMLPKFLYLFLRSSLFKDQVGSLRSGAAQPQFPIRDMKRVIISIPPLPIQSRITDILSAYDDLIENNKRRMQLLEEAARQLYREWFVRLRFPGHEHTKIIDGLPEGWERKPLGEVCSAIKETIQPKEVEPETPYIGLEHMPRRSISLSDWGTADAVTSTKYRFGEGDILFGKIRPYFHKVGVAFNSGITSSDAIVVRADQDDQQALLLCLMSSDEFVADTAQSMREGSKMPRADWKLMQQYPVLIPTPLLFDEFSETIGNVLAQLKILTFQNQKLRAARDLLLPKLMNGEIAV